MHLVSRADGPGEVVNVIAVVCDSLGAVGVIDTTDLHTTCANHLILRHSQLDVINAEIGEELGGGMILVAIPRALPPHPHFREPLPAQHEITFPSRSGLRLGKLSLECDLEL